MEPARTDRSRRQFCLGMGVLAVAAVLGPVPRASAQLVGAEHGRVTPPVPVPEDWVLCADGTFQNLARLTRGHATALQLMFTGCPSVCPIQAAIFQRVQQLLPDQTQRGIQLLSLSIDPVNDTQRALRAWLKKFRARDGWIAAAPKSTDLDGLLALFGQGRIGIENHVTQVSIINRRSELIWRTFELPSADSIADILLKI